MSKTWKLFGAIFLGVTFYFVIGFFSGAYAYENIINGDTKINGGLGVEGDLYADHNNLFFNPAYNTDVNPTIDFKQGDSMIKEMGDLYILSDDYVHIGPSQYASPVGRVLIQEPWEIAQKLRSAHGYLEAGTVETDNLLVSDNASVGGMFVANGTLSFGPSTTADFTNATIIGFGTGGITLAGDVDMDGYDINNLNNLDMQGVIANDAPGGYITIDDGLDLHGNLFNTTGSVNINDNLVVTGTSDLRGTVSNTTGDLTFGDNIIVTGTADMRNSIWNSTGNVTVSDFLTVDNLAYLNGGINVNGGLFTVSTSGSTYIDDTLTVDNDSYFNDNIHTTNILPSVDDTWNIGSDPLRYVEVYLSSSGGVYVGDNTTNYMAYDNSGVNSYGFYDTYIDSDNSVYIYGTDDAYLFPGSALTYSYSINPDGTGYFLGDASHVWDSAYIANLYATTSLDVGSGNFTVDASGNTYIAGTFEVDGTSQLDGAVTINNTLDVTGDTTLADLYVNNIYPNADATYDIGSGTSRFNEVYLDNSGALIVGNYSAGDYMYYDNDGVNSAGAYDTYISSDNGYVQVDPATYIYLYPGSGTTYSYDFEPDSDSTYDIGASGNEWLNGYFDNLYGTTSLDIGSGNFTVDASGNTYAAGTLEVDGITYADGGVITNTVTASSGNLALTSSSGNVLVGGQNTVRIVSHSGDITIYPNGDLNIWSDTNAQNIYPDSDSTYDIGASGSEWLNGYFDNLYGTTSLDIGSGNFTVDASGNVYAAGTMEVDGQADFDGNVDANSGLDVTGADFTVGGGYGGTGATIYNATGNISSDGNIHADGTLSSGATITIDGQVGSDSIVSTRGMRLETTGVAMSLNTVNNQAINTGTGLFTAGGALTSTGLLTGNLGLTISGAVASLNANSNFATNINTGTSTGIVTIGNALADVAIVDPQWAVTGAGAATFATVDTGQGANELYDMDQNVLTTSAVTFATVDTGQGANELYAMDQNVRTTDAVTFLTVDTGQGANELYDMDQNVLTTSAVTFVTVDTGQGANELYDMNQNVQTTDAVTFATVDTGQGANELYDMDQNVLTTSDVLFNTVTVNNTGLHILDTNASHDLIVSAGSDLTADRTLTVITGDAGRIITLSADVVFDQSLSTLSAVTFATLDTGQGANELYDMNQNVQTTDAVTFATLDTGQGANELYDMDQNVLTTSLVQFAGLTLTGDITTTGAAIDWDLQDNVASALSIDDADLAGLINFITTDGSEGISLAGALTANGLVDLGDGGDDVSIDSNDWDITSAGVASGFTGITSTGTVDFSGASVVKIMVNSTAPACAAAGDRGSIYYDPDDQHTYICSDNGAGGYTFKQLDN